MAPAEASLLEHLTQNRHSFDILRLQWEVETESVAPLFEAIRQNDTVRYVFFYDFFFQGLSMNERREFLKSIASLPKLESLVYISNSSRVKFPVCALAEVMCSCKELTTFELHGPNLVGKRPDFNDFFHFLGQLPKLKTVKLLPVYFGSGSIDLDHLFSSLSRLESLEEVRICLYCDKMSVLTSTGLRKVCRSESLKILDLRWPHLTDDHVTAISLELRDNLSLRELRIAGNDLFYSCYSLAEMIEVNEGIGILSLACKGLCNDDCCNALWKAFGSSPFLEEITLENTDTYRDHDTGTGESIGRMMADNSSIVTLRLYNMGINDDACYSMANALRVNTTLRTLDMRKGNRCITNEGFEALAHMLERNYTLHELQTNARGSIRHQIEVCLKLNKSAKRLQADLGADIKKGPTAGILLCGTCQ